MKSFQDTCVDLRKKDYTLFEIVQITGRSKTSIYHHIKGMPLSPTKQASIKLRRSVLAKEVSRSRKGISKNTFLPILIWNNDTVSLVAHLIFDGEVKRWTCNYNNRSLALIDHVERRMRQVYLVPPKRYINPKTGVTRISFNNVALAKHLKIKTEELRENISLAPPEQKRSFLQAFFDDEGCIDFRPQKGVRQIRGYQKDVRILYLVQKLLADIGIISRVLKPNEIAISGKDNLFKFQKEIGFSPGISVNGDRPNSRWKQSLEKREILSRAIASFKPIGSNGVHRS